MKVLVVGAGRMGTIRVTDLVSDNRVSDVLVTNRSPQRALDCAREHGATAVPWADYPDAEFDAVVVAVGTDAHDEVLGAVLPRGVPVLCEKPISLSLEGTQSLIDSAERHGAGFQVGFQRRFDPALRAVHDTIARGELGTVYSLTMTSHDHAPSSRDFIAGSGGIFRDLHVHDFDVARWLTGDEIETVFATTSVREFTDYADFDDADVSSIVAVMRSGAHVLITGTRHDPRGHDVRLEAFGSLDSMSAGLNRRTPIRTVEQDLSFEEPVYGGFVDRFRDAFRAETQAFVSFAAGEIDNPCPPAAAVESLRVAIACERSVTEKRAIAVADIR